MLRFTKMHGLGNDFVVFDAVNQTVALTPDQLRQLADRHFGIGCDQILLVQAQSNPTPTFTTAFSTPTAAKSPSAATAPAASPASCGKRACAWKTKSASTPAQDACCCATGRTGKSRWTWACRASRPPISL